ncbi:DUF1501 domain-containing protein [Tautonia marina]|uniref:DUF1501 domain-containing protein n=1 Tax=Tautonia marina TaxID=2653855 RepID=UPI0012609CCD|nr:DUF1501 domain-containing protein [Tautonia marina]
MFRILGNSHRACDGPRRRDVLRIGGLTALGLGLPQLLGRGECSAAAPGSFGRAKSCVLIYLFGGPSQIDMYDLKPEAPEQIRGEFRPIATATPGMDLCEHLPRLAKRSEDFCLIRSMRHEHPRHGWGVYYMLTGKKHSRPDLDAPPTPEDFPGPGALISHLAPRADGAPAAVTLPRWNRFNDLPDAYAGERGGFLGSAFDPWLVRSSSAEGLDFEPDVMTMPAEVGPGRIEGRKRLLARLDARLDHLAAQGEVRDQLVKRAFALIGSTGVRRAFRLNEEPEPIRERYGRHPFGQGLLLARRLVEAGTRLVQVNWHDDGSDVKSPFWDTHQDNFGSLRDRLLPPLDQALSSLLEDLSARGLLEETLVVVMGEFGRTPRVGQVVMNAATDGNGRDHWPHAYTVLAAGGGVRGGSVFGATDAHAGEVVDSPVSPPDLQATVLHLLGIEPATLITDRLGRQHRASDGEPVLGMLG